MERKRWFTAVVAVCVGLLSFAGSAVAQETRGALEVPLDHAQPDGPKLDLSYVHFTREPDRPRGTIVFLAGGPGEPAVRDAESVAGLIGSLRNTYEVVVFDQRGTGRSSALRCPGLRSTQTAAARAITDCGTRIGERRRFFSTYETALDLEDLRRHLGLERIIPLGVSYGGQVAGEYARRFPDRTQAVILDSTSPIEGIDVLGRLPSLAVPRVLDEICFTPRCERALGDTSRMLARTVERLANRVAPRLTNTDLYALVRASDSDLLLRAELPAALQAAAVGDEAPLLRLRRYAEVASAAGGVNAARFLATTCMEGTLPWAPDSEPESRVGTLAEVLIASREAYSPFPVTAVAQAIPATLCEHWPATPRPPSTAGQPGPDVPVLVLAGREDLRTPLEDQRRAAAQFPNARVVAVPGVGHSVLNNDWTGCAERALTRFLAGRVVPPCPVTGERPIEPALQAIQRLRDVPRARGDVPALIGRTATAVDLTLRDAGRWSLIELNGLKTFRGLRGGRIDVTRTTMRLTNYEVVPGVRVSGSFGPRRPNVIRVTGSGATGTLRFVGRTALKGVLNGRRVTYRSFDPTPVSSF